MKRVLLLGGLWLMCSGFAHPTTLITHADDQHPYYIWVGMAKVPTPDGAIRIYENDLSRCKSPLTLACTDSTSQVSLSPWADRPTFLHELGHIFLQQRGLLNNERMADAYSLCARRWRFKSEWALSVGSGLISGSRLNRVCQTFRV